MRTKSIAALVLLSASICGADATVEQKSQFHFAGALGGVINVFSRSAREGVTSTTTIHGNRKLTRSGDNGELIDLDQEKIYTIDFDDKTYTVKTFAEIRRELEEQRERAKKNSSKGSKPAKSEGPEYEVDFDMKSTGKKETINGWNTHQEIVTVTVREKGRKLEQSGGFVLTSDMWMGPKVAAMREMTDFDRRFAQKLYGPSFAADVRQLTMAMAMTPAFGKAMKVFYEKRSSFEGSPIRTNMKFETVAASDQPKEETTREDREEERSSAAAAAIGGLFNKMKQRNQDKKAKSSEPATPGRSEIFSSTLDVNRAVSSASAADVAIPANFKQR